VFVQLESLIVVLSDGHVVRYLCLVQGIPEEAEEADCYDLFSGELLRLIILCGTYYQHALLCWVAGEGDEDI